MSADTLERYNAWVAAQGVYCHDSVKTTHDGVVAGFGCVATRKIRKGEVLFRVPREACFGPSSGAAIDAEAPGDTQRRFAVRLLKEHAKGVASRWEPLLAVLSPAPCPWIWPKAAQESLTGTELEAVLARKHGRLRRERKKLGLADERAHAYDAACALVASHLNPWFGGSITPVNCTLNYDAEPNVEFEAEGTSTVVARALRSIGAGAELTQEYCESTAMFVVRLSTSSRHAQPTAPQPGSSLQPPASRLQAPASRPAAMPSRRRHSRPTPPTYAAQRRRPH